MRVFLTFTAGGTKILYCKGEICGGGRGLPSLSQTALRKGDYLGTRTNRAINTYFLESFRIANVLSFCYFLTAFLAYEFLHGAISLQLSCAGAASFLYMTDMRTITFVFAITSCCHNVHSSLVRIYSVLLKC